MESLTNDILRSFNRKGLIPGPHETERDFLERANYCLNLSQNPPPPFEKEKNEASTQKILEDVFPKTKKLFDVTPHWVPLVFSNYQLTPWHGGCTWIFQMNEESPTAALLQLRKKFLKNATYLGIYHREELVAHEICHVGRMMFEEPHFEEVLAYRTSNSSLRRFLGPIVKSAFESLVFALTLFLLFVIDFSLILFDQADRLIALSWLKLIPLGMMGWALVRLCQRQGQFKRCLYQLNSLLQDETSANAVLYRLTDQEIIDFSQQSLDDIHAYIKKEGSLRWKVLKLAYFDSE
jgi:hypothetical protein